MTEEFARILTLSINGLLALIVIFGLAKWFGKTDQLLVTLTGNVNEVKASQLKHEEQDERNFAALTKDINGIHVHIAGMPGSHTHGGSPRH